MKERAINVRDLRTSNRARALTAIYLDSPITRQEISVAAQVSSATVSNLVGDLLRQGIVVETDSEESDGGRPRARLSVNPDYGSIIGVDVGETAILVELFDLRMQVHASHTAIPESLQLSAQDTVDRIVDGIERVITDARVDPDTVLGVGVAVPGIVVHDDAATVHAQAFGWDGVPFGDMLRAAAGLPIFVENGAKTLGQAEKLFGAARHADNVVVLLLGAGTGAAIFVNGELYRGTSSSASEWGHTTVDVAGRRCRCGAEGCLEAYVGAPAIVSRYVELCGTGAGSEDSDLVTQLSIMAESGASDPYVGAVLDELATYLGAGVGGLINLFNPNRIVIGGWVAQILGKDLISSVARKAADSALHMLYEDVSIVPAELGRDAVALGAATLPISEFLASGGTYPRLRTGTAG